MPADKTGASLPSRLKADARRRLADNKRIKRFLYARRNRKIFADLYQHDRMLADRIRTDAYWAAISKYIGPGDVVVDLGTGTGVLAMFAARQGAKVHAIEHGPIVEAAEAVARDNGLDIEFHRTHSGEFELPGKADFIIHEQIGEAAYDERIVENIPELRDRVLKPGGRILPNVLDLYIEPVELTDESSTPFAWQQSLHGVDFGAIEGFAERSPAYLYRVLHPFPLKHFLCAPRPVVEIDLEVAQPGDLPNHVSFEREVVEAGRFDGYCVYFEARFDDEIGISASPRDPQTCWGSPLLRVEPRQVEAGEVIGLDLKADDLAKPDSWRW